MNKLRKQILILLSIAFFGAGSLIYNFILFPFINAVEKDREKRLNRLCEIVQKSWRWFAKYLCNIKVIDISVKNPEKLNALKSSVIVATHTSYIDVLILIALIPKTTCFVAPKLGNNIFFKNIVKSVFLISGLSIEELEEKTEYMLEKGFNVLIFPSGTRHKRNEIPKLHKGAALIAMNARKDIVPIKIYSENEFMMINKPVYETGEKTSVFEIEVLETIKIKKYLENTDEVRSKRELTKEIEKRLYGSLKE